jgi:hypothetical protein
MGNQQLNSKSEIIFSFGGGSVHGKKVSDCPVRYTTLMEASHCLLLIDIIFRAVLGSQQNRN